MTGKFRGLAHKKCNLNFKLTNTIPVVFHNLRGYDSHLIMQEMGAIADELNMRIGVIPNNMEKYQSSTLDKNIKFFL